MGDRPADGPAEGSPGIRTFLIADVRGYTLFTQERGTRRRPSSRRGSPRSREESSRSTAARSIELRGDEALGCSLGPAGDPARPSMHRSVPQRTLAEPTLPLPVGSGWTLGRRCPSRAGTAAGHLTWRRGSAGGRGRGDSREPRRDPSRSEGRRRAHRGSGRAPSEEPDRAGTRRPIRVRAWDPAIAIRPFTSSPAQASPCRSLVHAHPRSQTIVAWRCSPSSRTPWGPHVPDKAAPAIAGDALARSIGLAPANSAVRGALLAPGGHRGRRRFGVGDPAGQRRVEQIDTATRRSTTRSGWVRTPPPSPS